MSSHGLRIMASLVIDSHPEMYKVIDTLNRTLKDHDILFGLSLNDDDRMTITIYDSHVSDHETRGDAI